MTHNISPEEQLTILKNDLGAALYNLYYYELPDGKAGHRAERDTIDRLTKVFATYLRTLQEKMPNKVEFFFEMDGVHDANVRNETIDQCQSVLQTAIQELEK